MAKSCSSLAREVDHFRKSPDKKGREKQQAGILAFDNTCLHKEHKLVPPPNLANLALHFDIKKHPLIKYFTKSKSSLYPEDGRESQDGVSAAWQRGRG